MAQRPTNFDGFDFNQFDPDAKDNDNNEDNSNETCTILVKDGRRPFWISQGNIPVEFKFSRTILWLKEYFRDNIEHPTDPTGYNRVEGIKFRNSKGNNGIMADDETLGGYAQLVGNEYVVNITVTYKVKGGSKIKDDKKDNNSIVTNMDPKSFFSFKNKARDKKRVLPTTKKFPLSKQKCIITHDVNPKNNAYMPCKHTISPSALFDVMLWTFIKTQYQYDIYCPLPKCQKKWNFYYCAAVACLNKNEFMFFESEREFRKSPSKTCPNCGKLCERPKNLKYYRVACSCGKGDWCFECENKWTGGGFTVCGNKSCHTSQINDLLKNCDTDHTVGGKKVPELRACPSCYALTQHTRACKHMHCKSCGNYFCFICLHVPTKHANGKPNWKCGSSDIPCEVKGTQTVK